MSRANDGVIMVTAYSVIGKRKSFDICLAFIRGCNGQIGTKYRGGAAFFFGVDSSNVEIWEQVLANRDDFYYGDNSYFDSTRQKHFRVSKNRLQHSGLGVSNGARFKALGIEIKPWRSAGSHIVVCPQSDSFMKTLAGYSGDWTTHIVASLKAVTDREIRVRKWSANKAALAATLEQDLKGAHCLVTWSSAAAVTAVLRGVPVIVESKDCAAKPMAGSIDEIEALPMPDRENWAGCLADAEWSLEEMSNGTAWRSLNG